MMMNGDKKGIAALIIKKIGSGPEKMEEKPESEYGAEMDNSAGIEAAVSEMFEAIKSENKKEFAEALKSFIELCDEEEDEEEEEGEEPSMESEEE